MCLGPSYWGGRGKSVTRAQAIKIGLGNNMRPENKIKSNS